MRFITEFELRFPYQLSVLETYKIRHQLDIGNQIGEAFDWQNEHDEEKDKHRLGIEAFPMDKWVEFKQKVFFEMLEMGPMFSGVRMLELIKELESFGKPEEIRKPL